MPRPFRLLHIDRWSPLWQADTGGEAAAPAPSPETAAPETATPAPAAPDSFLSDAPTSEVAPEAAPAAEAAPPTIDLAALAVPEGFELSDDLRAEFAGVLSNAELEPQARAQALVDLHARQVSTALEAATAKMVAETATAYAAMADEWRTATRALPQFADGKFESEVGAMKQALLAQGATPEFFRALEETGAGINPHILDLLHKLTLPYREGGPVSGNPTAASQSVARSLYPTMKG